MSCKITDLMNKIDNVKSEIKDASYLQIMTLLAQIKEEKDNYRKRIHRLKHKCYKIHYQLIAVTDWAVAQEWDDEEGDLVFIENF
jgi:uncharacterized protein YhaN|tara:strand:+ start:439 stop:693 length:255 start_codon:yes stop_codon:yes gene_type:complete